VRSEGFYVNEKSTDTSWDRTETFRFVAQHLNHCATAVPRVGIGEEIIMVVVLLMLAVLLMMVLVLVVLVVMLVL